MKWGRYLVLLALAGIVQAALWPAAGRLDVRPDLLLLLALAVAVHLPARDALPAAWLAGLAEDLLSLNRPGSAALAFLLAAGPLSALRESLPLEGRAGRALAAAAATFLAGGVLFLLAALGEGCPVSPALRLRLALLAGVHALGLILLAPPLRGLGLLPPARQRRSWTLYRLGGA